MAWISQVRQHDTGLAAGAEQKILDVPVQRRLERRLLVATERLVDDVEGALAPVARSLLGPLVPVGINMVIHQKL